MIESAEKVLSQKPRAAMVASAVMSPPRKPYSHNPRRVYMDDDTRKHRSSRDSRDSDGRRVIKDQRSVQVTISSSEKSHAKERSDSRDSKERSSHKDLREKLQSSKSRHSDNTRMDDYYERHPRERQESRSTSSRGTSDNKREVIRKKSSSSSNSNNKRDADVSAESRIDRKVSLHMDESNFEPDYELSESDDDQHVSANTAAVSLRPSSILSEDSVSSLSDSSQDKKNKKNKKDKKKKHKKDKHKHKSKKHKKHKHKDSDKEKSSSKK